MSQALTIAPARSVAPIHPRDDTRPSFERGVREFQTEAEMKAASLEVRRRLFSPKIHVVKAYERQWKYAPAPLPQLPLTGKEAVIHSVLTHHNMSMKEITGKSRFPEHIEARHDMMRRLHHELGLSSVQIGKIVCRDHVTVLYALGRINRKGRKS